MQIFATLIEWRETSGACDSQVASVIFVREIPGSPDRVVTGGYQMQIIGEMEIDWKELTGRESR